MSEETPIPSDETAIPLDNAAPEKPSLGSRMMSAAGTIGKGALETLAAPFQVAGEAIRGAGEGEPLRVATASNPKGFRAPSIVQRMAPALRTDQPPADPFVKAYQGLEGVANLPNGIQKASDTVTAKPDLAANIGGGALALGTGEAGNLPMKAVTKTLGAPLKMAPKLLGKLAEFSNVTKEADPALLSAAKEANFPITPAGVTGSGTQSSMESALATLPFSKDIMTKRYTSQIDSLKGMRDKLFQSGQATNQVDQEIEQQLAHLIQDKVVGSSQNAYKASQADYQAVGNSVQGKNIPVSNLEKTAQQIFEEQGKLPPSSRGGGVSGLLNDLKPQETTPPIPDEWLPKGIDPKSPEGQAYLKKISGLDLGTTPGPKQFDYQTLQGIRADLNDRIAKADAAVNPGMPGMKFQSSPEAGVYKRLKSALDQDLSEFGQQKGNEGFSQAMDKANSNYSNYKQIFKENPLVTSIVKQQNPVDAIKIISRSLMKPNNLAESGTLQNLLGPEAYSYVSDHLATTLTSKNGQFSPTAAISNYEKLGDQSLTNILGEDRMPAYRSLYLLSKAAKAAEMNAGNPSGTGRMIGAYATLVRPFLKILTGGISSGVGTILSEATGLPALTDAYLSPTGMNLLTKQPVSIPSVPGVSQTLVASKYAGPLLGASQNADNQ